MLLDPEARELDPVVLLGEHELAQAKTICATHKMGDVIDFPPDRMPDVPLDFVCQGVAYVNSHDEAVRLAILINEGGIPK